MILAGQAGVTRVKDLIIFLQLKFKCVCHIFILIIILIMLYNMYYVTMQATATIQMNKKKILISCGVEK